MGKKKPLTPGEEKQPPSFEARLKLIKRLEEIRGSSVFCYLTSLRPNVAAAIVINGSHIGERVYADVIKNNKTQQFDLCVTKPYLEKGLFTVHFDITK